MQRAIDDQKIEYKKLSKFHVPDEKIYKSMTIYEYNFHLYALKDASSKNNV